MSNIGNFIESGILESYILGLATAAERVQVEKMSSLYPQVQEALDVLSEELERKCMQFAIDPSPSLKAMVFATIRLLEQRNDEGPAALPPILYKGATVSNYDKWVNDPMYALPEDAGNIYAKVISQNDQVATAIVWVKKELPWEVHEHELESFLIIEGSCAFYIEQTMYALSAGDYFSIPLNKKHSARVTSSIPCKVILQRIAV